MKKPLKIFIVTGDKDLTNVLGFCFDGWGYEVFFDNSAETDLATITKVSPDVIIIDVQSAAGSRLELCDLIKRDFSTAGVPLITLINKRQLRQQLLGLRLGVDDYLINPPDPLELRIRVEMAVKRSQQSFYASPLTGLPGSIVIEEVMRERMDGNKPFVAGHVDLDNFKSYNDKYGYLKGDRVIMQTAYMLTAMVRNLGDKDDFVGHIGGDDFVIITSPDKYNEICKNFVCMFDTITLFHYSFEDRKRGHIVAKDRRNHLRKIPLMSVTIALVLKDGPAGINSIIEMNERLAEVKQYLKKISGSKYLMDRRGLKKKDHLTVQVFSNDDSVADHYKPLGQILLEKNIVTLEQLDKALKIHWKRGVLLGEVLQDLGFLSEKKLFEALSCQENTLGAADMDHKLAT